LSWALYFFTRYRVGFLIVSVRTLAAAECRLNGSARSLCMDAMAIGPLTMLHAVEDKVMQTGRWCPPAHKLGAAPERAPRAQRELVLTTKALFCLRLQIVAVTCTNVTDRVVVVTFLPCAQAENPAWTNIQMPH
jgi:hypothetical protein